MIAHLRPVDLIEITVLVDNYTDLLLSEETSLIHRPILSYGKTLCAEHGLSFLVRVRTGEQRYVTILMDTGSTTTALLENARQLGIDLNEIRAIFISHGHYDHMGALVSALGLSSSTIPVYIHPAAFAMRRKRLSDGSYTDLPALTEDAITDAGGILVHVQQPTGIGDETMLLTGEIERTTAFEQGSPILEVKEGDSFVRDVFRDDQSLIMHLKGEGLVIVSGCAHAGIINSIRYAQKITGVQKIHAVIGGFHLSGPYFKEIIPQTVAAFQQINPAYIIPVHCTGWEAQTSIATAMPHAFVLSTVGTTFYFGN